MKISSMIVFVLTILLVSCTHTSVKQDLFTKGILSVIQGVTSEDQTTIRVTYPKALKLKYVVTDDKQKTYPVKRVVHALRKDSPYAVDHIKVTKLKLGTNYTLAINSESKRWSDKRTFQTLDTKNEAFNFVVASCMSDSFNGLGDQMWPKVLSHKADALFLIGDNIYADVFSGVYLGALHPVTPSHLWKRYVDHAMTMRIYFASHLIPTYTIWDDHDFGKNDGGSSYIYKKQAKKIFNTFFSRAEGAGYSKGPGVSRKLTIGGVNYFFLDGRSFRSKENNKSGAHLGKKQLQWLMSNIDQEYNWLIAGDQFFGAYHPYESYAGEHPEEFASFLKQLKMKKKKYLFLGGDRHLVEEMKIPANHVGHESREFTISGIHTKMYPGSLNRNANPLRTGGFDGKANYGLFETRVAKDQLEISFNAFSLDKQEMGTRHVIK